MSASNEWWELHLTPRGWVDGSEKMDFSPLKEVEPPADRVLTVRHREHQSSIYSRNDVEDSETYRSTDAKLVAELLARFGARPGVKGS